MHIAEKSLSLRAADHATEKGSPVPAEITRDLPYDQAMAALADYARRLGKTRFASPPPPLSKRMQDLFAHLQRVEDAGLLADWPEIWWQGHGDPRIDNSDGFATLMLLRLCNHDEPSVANEARRVLECFQANVRCIVRAPR